MKNVLVLNMGMKSIRSIVFSENGQKLGTAARPIKTAIDDIRVEQNPNEWWEKAIEVMQESIYDARIEQLDYITVTTSASCLVCLQKNGEVYGNAMMVSDKRANEEVEQIKNAKEYPAVYEKTGMEMNESLLLPKILWIKNHKPKHFEEIEFFLAPNDFLIYKLCGEICTDYLNALKYHYDLNTKTYPEELLKELGLSEKTFPNVVDTGIAVGKINKKVAEEVGIYNETQIVVTSYDAICSFIGSGVTDEGEASDVSGTVTVFRALTKNKNAKGTKQVYSFPVYQTGYNVIGGSNNLGGGLIEWVKQCYYLKEEYPYEVMEKDAMESDIGAKGILFLPYLLGERAPIWNNNARGIFFGLERMHTRKDMTRAVFESTGFIDMSFMEAIRQGGTEVSSVRVSGGLARVNTVSQIKADMLNKDIMVLSDFETTANGAAMMVLHGMGDCSSLETLAERFATVRMIIKPNKANHEKYVELYDLYKELYATNLELFEKRKEVLSRLGKEKEIRIENL